MIAVKQIKRVPKNHQIVIDIPNTIEEDQIIEVILLCKEKRNNNKSDKIALLKNSLSDNLFMNDHQTVSNDFISIDHEVW